MLQSFSAAVLRHPFARRYMTSLEARPIATKCATSGALMLASDALRQKLEQAERDEFRWDAARTARMTAFAIAFHAPFLHHLHIFYEALWPRLGVRHTAVKVAGGAEGLLAPRRASIGCHRRSRSTKRSRRRRF